MCRVEPAGFEQSGTPHDKPSRHSLKMSLINALKSVGEAGQPATLAKSAGEGDGVREDRGRATGADAEGAIAVESAEKGEHVAPHAEVIELQKEQLMRNHVVGFLEVHEYGVRGEVEGLPRHTNF